jgi:Domain of unknown function (DUF4129)
VNVLRRYWSLVAAAVLLLVAAFGAATGSMPLRPAPIGDARNPLPTFDPHLVTSAPAQPDAASPFAQQQIQISPAFARVVQLLCLALVVGVVVLLVTLLVRGAVRRVSVDADPVVRRPQQDSHQEVMAALAQGLAELDEGDPRQAVIACWVRLERAAEDAGMQRKPGDTPTDLVLRLLGGRSVTSSVLNDFADVYREARYSPHPVGTASRDQARAALRLLRDELGAMSAGAAS